MKLVGVYDGNNLDVEEIAQDIATFEAMDTHNKLVEEGMVFVGSYDWDTPEEIQHALDRKATLMHEIEFFGKRGHDVSDAEEELRKVEKIISDYESTR